MRATFRLSALIGVILSLPCAVSAQSSPAIEAREEVPPPPPAGTTSSPRPALPPPPTAPPPVVVAAPPTVWVSPPRPGPELLPAAQPFMLGFGFAVLGGLGVAGTTAVLLEAPSVDRDLVLAATLAYAFSAAFSGVGLVLMVGALAGEVKLYSRNPGWAWTAAVFSALGGVGALAAVISWQVDGQFGADSIGYTLAAAGCYGLTALVFLGLDAADDPATRVALTPAPGGGAVHVSGRF